MLLLVGKIATGSAGASEGGNDGVASDEPESLGGAKATPSPSPINLECNDDKGGNDAQEAPTDAHHSKPRAHRSLYSAGDLLEAQVGSVEKG